MTCRDFTADELETIIVNALKARDLVAVVTAIKLLVVKDPVRAEAVYDTIELGLALAPSFPCSAELLDADEPTPDIVR